MVARPPNPPDRPYLECRPRQGRHLAKGDKGVGPPQSPPREVPMREAGRSTLGERSPRGEDDPGGGKHSGSSQYVWPSRDRRTRWAFGGCGSDGHSNACTHASVTTGCSGRVESGLCSSFSSPRQEREYILELGAPGRCSPARASRKRTGAARSFGVRAFTVKREGGSRGERVWLRPAHARGNGAIAR